MGYSRSTKSAHPGYNLQHTPAHDFWCNNGHSSQQTEIVTAGNSQSYNMSTGQESENNEQGKEPSVNTHVANSADSPDSKSSNAMDTEAADKRIYPSARKRRSSQRTNHFWKSFTTPIRTQPGSGSGSPIP